MGISLSSMSYHRLNEKVTEYVNFVLFNYSLILFVVDTLEAQKKLSRAFLLEKSVLKVQ